MATYRKFKRLAGANPDWPLFLVAGAMLAAWWLGEEL